MSRNIRIELPATLYRDTPHGNRRENIFEDDENRRALLNAVRYKTPCC